MGTAANVAAASRRRATGEATHRPQTRYTLDDYTGAGEAIRERHRAAYADGQRECFTPELRDYLATLARLRADYEAETDGTLFGALPRKAR